MLLFKYHGIGNDFLIADLRPDSIAADQAQSPAIVRALCDRHRGIGADGLLAVLPPKTTDSDARMRVLNADGSEAEMCGNGIRCVVKYLLDESPDLRSETNDELTIDTGAGPLHCIAHRAAGHVNTVTVDMGRPHLLRGEIPMTGPAQEQCLDQPISVAGEAIAVTAVSMGNPHAITFVSGYRQAELRQRAETIGPLLERDPMFPQRTNVEIAQVNNPTDIDLLVWERGVGITNACGTGACATAVAACLIGHAQQEQEICVRLLGGELAITVAQNL